LKEYTGDIPLVFWAMILLAFFAFACNDSFEPLKENNNAFFSMYGFLDASADTQWVRVTPVRDQIEMAAVTPDVQVTLEDLETGSTVVMNDSLSQLRNGINVLNFWTKADIETDHSYLLKAEQADGAISRAAITMPEEVPILNLQYFDRDSCRATLRIRHVEPLADVQTVWNVRIQSGDLIRRRLVRFAHRNDDSNGGMSTYSYFLNIRGEGEALILPAGMKTLLGIDIYAASGGPDWIEDIASIDDLEYALPEGLSNVENGLGYVVGIASSTVPYEGCEEQINEDLEFQSEAH
jgi:hypothetical protein